MDYTNLIYLFIYFDKSILELLWVKYRDASRNLIELENLGCTILHDVNVHTMTQHQSLKGKKFDRIIFNFPHAGFTYKEIDYCQIE